MNGAYEAGYDCGMSGPNTKNCFYGFFSAPEKTAEWERGKFKAEQDKQAKESHVNE
jgi:hypothetical protein